MLLRRSWRLKMLLRPLLLLLLRPLPRMHHKEKVSSICLNL